VNYFALSVCLVNKKHTDLKHCDQKGVLTS